MISAAFKIPSEHVDRACSAFNSLPNNQRTGDILEYFEDIFNTVERFVYVNGSSVIEQSMEYGSATRRVTVVDGETILQVNINGLITSEPFFYYKSEGDCSFYVKENSSTVIELNEKEMSYRLIENGDTSRIY